MADPLDPKTDSLGPSGRAAMLLHVICCGIPLLLLAVVGGGVTLEGVRRALPYVSAIGGAVLVAALLWTAMRWRRRRSLACRHCEVDAPRLDGHRDHGGSTDPLPRGAEPLAPSAHAAPTSGGKSLGRDR